MFRDALAVGVAFGFNLNSPEDAICISPLACFPVMAVQGLVGLVSGILVSANALRFMVHILLGLGGGNYFVELFPVAFSGVFFKFSR